MSNILSFALLVVGLVVAYFVLDKIEKAIIAKAKKKREKRNGRTDEHSTEQHP